MPDCLWLVPILIIGVARGDRPSQGVSGDAFDMAWLHGSPCCGGLGSGQSVMFRFRVPSTASPLRLWTLRQRERAQQSGDSCLHCGQRVCVLSNSQCCTSLTHQQTTMIATLPRSQLSHFIKSSLNL